MRIRIAAEKSTPVAGTRRVSSVVLSLRQATEVLEATVDLESLKATIRTWASRLDPEERRQARFRVYALVLGKAGGVRRKILGDWNAHQPLDAFLEGVAQRFAEIPVDEASFRALSRDAWVDEQEFVSPNTTKYTRDRAGRRTKA